MNPLQKIINSFRVPKQNNSMNLPSEFLRYGSRRKSLTPDWGEVLMSDKDFYTGYSYAMIQKRANRVATTALSEVTTDHLEDNDSVHPYLELIEASSDFSEFEFWRNISIYLDLEGVFYLMAVRAETPRITGEVQYFKLLNPYNIKKVVKKADSQDTKELGGYIEFKDGKSREIPAHMIIEIKELNPFGGLPFAMTDAARESQFTLKTSDDYTRQAIKHNINAPGIISTAVELDEDQFRNFRSRIKEHTSGEPLFANGSGVLNWESMQNQLKDSALDQVNEINRDILFSVGGVSKTLMGIEQSGTTRETARVQKDLNMEDHILPRIQLVLDSLNLDYRNHYAKRYELLGKPFLIVNNPLGTDFDSEIKKVDAEAKKFDLYKKLINAGVEAELASAYVEGEIKINGIGEIEKFEPPIMDEEPEDEPEVEEENHLHLNQIDDLLIGSQESSLKNSIVNIEARLVAEAIKGLNELAVYNEIDLDLEEIEDLIPQEVKRDSTKELILTLSLFYLAMMLYKGGATAKERSREYEIMIIFSVDTAVNKWVKQLSKTVGTGHIETVSNDIFKSVRESALAGKSRQEIVDDLLNKYSDTISKTRAETIARTEAQRALNRAQYEADRQFVNQNKLKGRAFKVWETHSQNPCEFCKALADEGEIPFDQPFRGLGSSVNVEIDGKAKDFEVGYEEVMAGNLHPNCILPDSIVLAPEAQKLMRANYSGDVFEVVTASGRRTTVTPNHIMLTTRGWVAAKNLRKTDSVINYLDWDKIPHLKIDPTNNNSPVTVEQIFTSLTESLGMPISSVPITSKHLKGDGAFGKGDIDIVSTDSLLRDYGNLPISEFFKNQSFESARMGFPVEFVKGGDLSSMLFCLGATADGLVSLSGLGLKILEGTLTEKERISLTSSTAYNTRIQQSLLDDTSTNTQFISELLLRLSSLVSHDHIVDIKRSGYSGHVYDLSTYSTLYIVNGMITSNCACSYSLIIKPE